MKWLRGLAVAAVAIPIVALLAYAQPITPVGLQRCAHTNKLSGDCTNASALDVVVANVVPSDTVRGTLTSNRLPLGSASNGLGDSHVKDESSIVSVLDGAGSAVFTVDEHAGSVLSKGGWTGAGANAPTMLGGGTVDNLALTDPGSGNTLDKAYRVSMDASANTNVTGFDSSTISAGFFFQFRNVSTFKITLKNATGSTGPNQFDNGHDWIVYPKTVVPMTWNGTHWYVAMPTDIPGLTSGGNIAITGPTGAVAAGSFLTGFDASGSPTTDFVSAQFNPYANSKHYEVRNEHWVAPQITNVVDGFYTCTFTGTGAGFSAATNPGRDGVLVASTGTTSTGRASCSTTTAIPTAIHTDITTHSTFGIPVIDDASDKYVIWQGLIQTVSAVDQTAGCFVRYDHNDIGTAPASGSVTTGDHLQAWCCTATVCTGYEMDGSTTSDESFTTANVAIANRAWPSTNILSVKILFTVGTRAEFFVDTGGGYVKSADINTHLPNTTTVQNGWSILKNANATARTFEVDIDELAVNLASSRAAP